MRLGHNYPRERPLRPASKTRRKSMNNDEIESTFLKRLEEAHKSQDLSFSIYAVLTLTAAIVIFSTHVTEGKITIPFLSLAMDKFDGTEIILLCAFVFLFRYFSLEAYTVMFTAKLR